MTAFRDRKLEAELQLDGLDPRASREVFDDLTRYLHQPIEAIARDYWRCREGEDVAAQERVAKATAEADVINYYVGTPHYLYELSYWEASGDKQAWFQVLAKACRRFGLQRVLDFGGGVGGVSLFLRRRGIACDHLDVPSKTSAYAAWRFTRHHANAQVLDATKPAGWPRGAYDAVVAWDVLEHMFDLDQAVGRIGALLRPGGSFLSKSTFAEAGGQHLHIHLAKHAVYAEVARFNDLVGRAGFRYLGQLKPNRLSRLLRTCGLRYTVAGIRISPRLKHGGNFLVHVKHL